ncbi:hypothetical protein ABZX74_00600 [Streptomyces olivaceoviridis]|uniref:hypothetical protein n=1 Tax=Streptomyces olivaceoviridis TaxID=1921 RepID=UPI0033A3E0B4
MKTTEHTELIRRFADDFTALQEAVLSQMNGVCAPETAAALEHASLVGPVTVVLAHADVLARGAVRRAELSVQPPERLRQLRAHARRVRRARSQAETRPSWPVPWRYLRDFTALMQRPGGQPPYLISRLKRDVE